MICYNKVAEDLPDKRTWWHPMYSDLHEDVKVTIQGRPSCTWRLYWKWGASIFPSSTSSIFLCSHAKVLFWPRRGHSCKYFEINLVQKEKKNKTKIEVQRLKVELFIMLCYVLFIIFAGWLWKIISWRQHGIPGWLTIIFTDEPLLNTCRSSVRGLMYIQNLWAQ